MLETLTVSHFFPATWKLTETPQFTTPTSPARSLSYVAEISVSLTHKVPIHT